MSEHNLEVQDIESHNQRYAYAIVAATRADHYAVERTIWSAAAVNQFLEKCLRRSPWDSPSTSANSASTEPENDFITKDSQPAFLQSPSSISFGVEPFEAGEDRVIYMRLAPHASNDLIQRGFLFFRIDIINSGTQPVELTSIIIDFPGSTIPNKIFQRNSIQVPPGAQNPIQVWLARSEAIELISVAPQPAPTKINISLLLTGVDGLVTRTFNLGPHNISYPIPIQQQDSATFGDFLGVPPDHAGDGAEFLKYDLQTFGFVNNIRTTAKDQSKNEGYFGWNRPIYAMADGLILRADDTQPDNPWPSGRNWLKKNGEWSSQAVAGDFAITGFLTSWGHRILVAWISSGDLRLTLLAPTQEEQDILFKSELLIKGPVQHITIVAISSSRAVTATWTSTTLKVTLWQINKQDQIIKLAEDLVLAGAVGAKLLAMSETRFLVGRMGFDGRIRFTVWDITSNPVSLVRRKNSLDNLAIFGPVGESFDLLKLDSARFVSISSSDLASPSSLRLIQWKLADLNMGEFVLFPWGETKGPVGIARVGLQKIDSNDVNQFGVAQISAGNTLAITTWAAVDSNPPKILTKLAFERKGSVGNVLAADANGSALVLTQNPQSQMHLTVVSRNTSKTSVIIQDDDDTTKDLVVGFSACLIPAGSRPILATAAQLVNGNVKVFLWRPTYNNAVQILHGNEMVGLYHMRQGSLPQWIKDEAAKNGFPVFVRRGEQLGVLGNAGSSAGPHLHMECIRVFDELLEIDRHILAEMVGAGKTIGEPRPIQFDFARAARADLVGPGGIAANPVLSVVHENGGHFLQYAFYPDWPIKPFP